MPDARTSLSNALDASKRVLRSRLRQGQPLRIPFGDYVKELGFVGALKFTLSLYVGRFAEPLITRYPGLGKLWPGAARLGQQGHGSADLLPLFRQAAVNARRDRWIGAPHAAQPWPVQAVAAGSLLVAFATVAIIIFGHYTRRATVQGILASTTGVVRVTAPDTGRVERLTVKEGDSVKAGQVLYELATDSTTGNGPTQQEVQRILRRQRGELEAEQERQADLALQRKAALVQHMEDLNREIAQIESQSESASAFVDTLATQVKFYEALFEHRQVNNRDLLDRRQALFSQRNALENTLRDKVQREAAQHETRAEFARADAELATKLADLRRQVNDIDRLLAEAEARRSLRVVASADGVVTGLIAHQGAMVRAGEPMLTLAPAGGSLVAQLFAPSEAIGFIEPGTRVLMRYNAYAYQKFGQQPGVVTDISRVPLGIEEIERGVPLGAVNDNRAAMFRITVRPDHPTVSVYGQQKTPAIGERLEASVFLERRAIWQWILDPLYSLARATDQPG